jgi:hypothetical protein
MESSKLLDPTIIEDPTRFNAGNYYPNRVLNHKDSDERISQVVPPNSKAYCDERKTRRGFGVEGKGAQSPFVPATPCRSTREARRRTDRLDFP